MLCGFEPVTCHETHGWLSPPPIDFYGEAGQRVRLSRRSPKEDCVGINGRRMFINKCAAPAVPHRNPHAGRAGVVAKHTKEVASKGLLRCGSGKLARDAPRYAVKIGLRTKKDTWHGRLNRR